MNTTLQAELTPAAVPPGIVAMSAELETDLGELLASKCGGGENAALEWESSQSYEERFAELLSIFVPQDGCAAALGGY